MPLLLTGCMAKTGLQQPEKNMSDSILTGKKILMVIAPKDFRDPEYNEPRAVFDKNNIEVKVASIQGGVSVGAEGAEVMIDLTLSEVNAENFDAVAFIGGPGMMEIINDESMQILAKKFYEAGKLTAAICVAPSILAKAGVLEGKKATSWSGSQSDLEQGGAEFTGQSVTQDGNIITSDGPSSAKEFGEKIVEMLKIL